MRGLPVDPLSPFFVLAPYGHRWTPFEKKVRNYTRAASACRVDSSSPRPAAPPLRSHPPFTKFSCVHPFKNPLRVDEDTAGGASFAPLLGRSVAIICIDSSCFNKALSRHVFEFFLEKRCIFVGVFRPRQCFVYFSPPRCGSECASPLATDPLPPPPYQQKKPSLFPPPKFLQLCAIVPWDYSSSLILMFVCCTRLSRFHLFPPPFILRQRTFPSSFPPTLPQPPLFPAPPLPSLTAHTH